MNACVLFRRRLEVIASRQKRTWARTSAGWVASAIVASSFGTFALVERPAHAQVSDADRNAARDLYNDGWALQQAGHYADALDRYTRSLSVFPAPTTAYRIAQCKAALGKLVEAAEELRAVRDAPLPPNAPEAFVKAKQNAAADLQQIEVRIPKVRINIQPSGLQGLVIMIDNVSMATALVGVARPIDPGSHTITASAPGYSQAQAQVDVHEKEAPIPEITLTLRAGGGGVSYTPNGGSTTYQASQNQGGQNTYPNGAYSSGAYQGAYSGTSGYNTYNTWIPPQRRPRGPSNTFMLGVDGALSVPFGTFGSGFQDLFTIYGGVGGAGGVDLGLRLARIMYLGLGAQTSFFGGNSDAIPPTTRGISFSLNAVMGFMSNPEGLGFYGEFGGGLRTISFTNEITLKDATFVTGDVILGIGAQFKAGNFRFIPKIDLFVGPNQGGAHGFFTVGLTGYWELPLAHTQQPPASGQPINATPATATTPAE